MKVKIELKKGETAEQADEFLTKALSAKQECSGEERFADNWLNELEAHVCAEHRKVLDQLTAEIVNLVESHASR